MLTKFVEGSCCDWLNLFQFIEDASPEERKILDEIAALAQEEGVSDQEKQLKMDVVRQTD